MRMQGAVMPRPARCMAHANGSSTSTQRAAPMAAGMQTFTNQGACILKACTQGYQLRMGGGNPPLPAHLSCGMMGKLASALP